MVAVGVLAPQRLCALLHEHVTITVHEYPAALRLFLDPHSWPSAQAERIKQLRRRHDSVFRSALEDGIADGVFNVVGMDTALQCMHAAMTQAPLWLDHRAPTGSIDELADTLTTLAGCRPAEKDCRCRIRLRGPPTPMISA